MKMTGRVLAFIVSLFASWAAIQEETARAQAVQEPARSFDSLEALDAFYNRRLDELEVQRIADLTALAARKTGDDATRTYRELFQHAIDRDLLAAAAPAADRCLADPNTPTDVLALATHAMVIARIDQGKSVEALDVLAAFLRRAKQAQPKDGPSAEDRSLGLGEVTLQRLIHLKSYAVAKRACTLLCDEARDPVVRSHFEQRRRMLNLVGTPAPSLEGTDVEGQRFRSGGLTGKVVLVHFWATWCPPSVTVFQRLTALATKYEKRGFEVIGVNLDAHHEDVKEAKTVLPTVRHVLVEHGITWPNLLSDDESDDIATRFGVVTLPENFLIGRNGTLVGLELSDPELERSIEEALGKP